MSQFSSFYEVNVLDRALICFQNHAHKLSICMQGICIMTLITTKHLKLFLIKCIDIKYKGRFAIDYYVCVCCIFMHLNMIIILMQGNIYVPIVKNSSK